MFQGIADFLIIVVSGFVPYLFLMEKSSLLLPEFHRELICQCLTRLGLGGLEGVGVDVQRGTGLAVAQHGRYGPNILAVIDQQGCIQMAELVDPVKWESLPLAKLLKPLVGLLEANG